MDYYSSINQDDTTNIVIIITQESSRFSPLCHKQYFHWYFIDKIWKNAYNYKYYNCLQPCYETGGNDYISMLKKQTVKKPY